MTKYLFVITAGLLSVSCSKVFIQPFYIADEQVAKKLVSKKVILAVSSDIEVAEFGKSFASRFKTTDSCTKYLDKTIADSLKIRFPGIVLVRAEGDYLDAVDALPGKRASLDSIKNLPDSGTADYIVGIRKFRIGNGYSQNAGVMISSPSAPAGDGGMMMTGGSASELCEVTFNVAIWDLKTKKMQLNFDSRGSKEVSFFQYQATMVSAIDNSIHHFMEYLKSNKTESFD
jgi:hypothetical protein